MSIRQVKVSTPKVKIPKSKGSPKGIKVIKVTHPKAPKKQKTPKKIVKDTTKAPTVKKVKVKELKVKTAKVVTPKKDSTQDNETGKKGKKALREDGLGSQDDGKRMGAEIILGVCLGTALLLIVTVAISVRRRQTRRKPLNLHALPLREHAHTSDQGTPYQLEWDHCDMFLNTADSSEIEEDTCRRAQNGLIARCGTDWMRPGAATEDALNGGTANGVLTPMNTPRSRAIQQVSHLDGQELTAAIAFVDFEMGAGTYDELGYGRSLSSHSSLARVESTQTTNSAVSDAGRSSTGTSTSISTSNKEALVVGSVTGSASTKSEHITMHHFELCEGFVNPSDHLTANTSRNTTGARISVVDFRSVCNAQDKPAGDASADSGKLNVAQPTRTGGSGSGNDNGEDGVFFYHADRTFELLGQGAHLLDT